MPVVPLTAGQSSRWSAQPGVRFAEVQGEGVILDLVGDRYYGLSRAATDAWRQLFIEPESSGTGVGSSGDLRFVHREATDLSHHLTRWRDAGLVTAGDAVRPSVVPRMQASGVPAQVDVVDDARRAGGRSVRAGCQLAGAAWWCARRRHRDGLASLLCAVQALPHAAVPFDARRNALDSTLRTYMGLRRIVGQGRDDCLSRSLTLAVTLRRLGLIVDICFGVRKFPFLAHAWVEDAGIALNERAARLRDLTVVARIRTA